ncbi:MAG: peptide chain release factor N(5)-glutamine methyltransferase [Betaproteobacteria bacterium]|nr:peptide chain release factor N(5)-glutamine methyltransferase [Betaproteobacteria bacterium]
MARLDAQVLLGHVLGRDRTWLIAHGDEPLPQASRDRYARLLRRREAGEPIAYLVGHREFFGHRFAVGPMVLIPRPETELLVELALEALPEGAHVLELATGSGAIAISMALARPDLAVLATDISLTALAVAQCNARELGATIDFAAGDWYEALEPRIAVLPDPIGSAPPSRTAADHGRFDRIVANPPYIAQQDPHLQRGDLRFEPPGALASGADGLDAIRIIIEGAPARLSAGGCLLIEHGYDQGPAVRALLEAAGLHAVRSWSDLAGHDRVSTGVR